MERRGAMQVKPKASWRGGLVSRVDAALGEDGLPSVDIGPRGFHNTVRSMRSYLVHAEGGVGEVDAEDIGENNCRRSSETRENTRKGQREKVGREHRLCEEDSGASCLVTPRRSWG